MRSPSVMSVQSPQHYDDKLAFSKSFAFNNITKNIYLAPAASTLLGHTEFAPALNVVTTKCGRKQREIKIIKNHIHL